MTGKKDVKKHGLSIVMVTNYVVSRSKMSFIIAENKNKKVKCGQ